MSESKCPVMGGAHARGTMANQRWWPNQLNLKMLHQHSPLSDPMGAAFNYAEEFSKLDMEALRKDIEAVMTTSQDWWPADYGHYGPLFIRMAWHSAGTYRIGDGRGGASSGTLRFAPLNSWPDNANLDKARRLLWPIKQKYGRQISWADLMVFTGNCALESMGFKTLGFAGGRADVWEPEEDIYWGSETTWLGDERYTGDRELEKPLGAVQMGLIYVNPEGPNGTPDPLAAARDIRETFGRMAMNDEETVALNCRRPHVRQNPWGGRCGPVRRSRTRGGRHRGAGLGLEEQLWQRQGRRHDHERAGGVPGPPHRRSGTTASSTTCLATSGSRCRALPGRHSGRPGRPMQRALCRNAHDPSKRHAPMMLTTDLALKVDPIYAPIAKRFHENPQAFADAFAKAWYKLTHRDMGPRTRCLGPLVPAEPQLWQDPVPDVTHELIGEQDIAALKGKILASGLSIAQLVSTAWASAATFRGTDKRGGGERGAHPPRAAKGLGRQQSGRAGDGAGDPGAGPAGLQTARSPTGSGSRSPT